MKGLNKNKLLVSMSNRRDALYDQVTRDFGGGLGGRLDAHNELKYWKEAIERGEFDTDIQDGVGDETYVILSKEPPEIVDFTFYTDKEAVKNRIDELNGICGKNIFWYITMYSNTRNSGKLVEIGEN